MYTNIILCFGNSNLNIRFYTLIVNIFTLIFKLVKINYLASFRIGKKLATCEKYNIGINSFI